jgi:hypothetical protein
MKKMEVSKTGGTHKWLGPALFLIIALGAFYQSMATATGLPHWGPASPLWNQEMAYFFICLGCTVVCGLFQKGWLRRIMMFFYIPMLIMCGLEMVDASNPNAVPLVTLGLYLNQLWAVLTITTVVMTARILSSRAAERRFRRLHGDYKDLSG